MNSASTKMNQPADRTLQLDEQDYRLIMFLIGQRQRDVRRVTSGMTNYDVMSAVDVKLDGLRTRILAQN